MDTLKIDIAREFSASLLHEVCSLMPELSAGHAGPTEEELRRVVESPSTHLFVARIGAEVVGMLTLVLVQIPSGLRAHIEDVVVTVPYRGRGLGEALTRAAIDLAQSSGARTVDLTSRPSRIAAVKLYERMGFQRRDTNVFRLGMQPKLR